MRKQTVYGVLLCSILTAGAIGKYVTPTTISASTERSFDEDVENGLLYGSEDGKVTDKKGKVIPEYDYIEVLPNGGLMCYDTVMEGYAAGAGGKIVVCTPGPVEYDDFGLKPTPEVYEEYITTDINYVDNGVTDVYAEFVDDGNYFDEVVSGAWFGEDGLPLAKYPPMTVRDATDWWWAFRDEISGASRYCNIDDSCDMDTIKRSSDMEMVYSMLVKSVQKYTDEYGNVYLQGTEYYSDTPIVLKGNFGNTVLNNDDLLVFSKYIGLASDDTPNFSVFYAEIDNGRF